MLNVNARNLGALAVLTLQGQIVNGNTETLRSAVENLPPARTVILDVAQVSTVDAHGLGVMLDLRERAMARGMRFQLMNVSEPFRRVLEITRLDTVFHIISEVRFFPTVVQGTHATTPALRSCA
jgi:anti-sigma B factor antagonist